MEFRRFIGVFVVVVWGLSPRLALADWAYTHWGMTADQVVAGSAGTVKVLPQAQRTKNDYDHWELAAEGTFVDSGLSLSVGFTFDTTSGGLECVFYNAIGDDVQTLHSVLDKRYGKPKRESSYGPTRSFTWKTPDEIELVIGEKPVAAAVTHCVPSGG